LLQALVLWAASLRRTLVRHRIVEPFIEADRVLEH
jgi:hypothetical protein